ncbi:MAG TPA: 50S ribosomal protein L25 [Candidatus Paceibacterota bacterium]
MELAVQKREQLGRGVHALRTQNLIPAELYGKGVSNMHLAVPAKDFKKVFKEAGENTIVNIIVDGKKYPAFIYDVSYHGVTDEILNIDFYQVRMDEKIKIGVPIEFIGIASAVKSKNGILVKALQELEVEALPSDIPHSIAVDIAKLDDIGQSLYVKDIVVPVKVKVLVAPDTVVATITAQITEEEELAMQQAAGAGVETVKVETEEKKAERDAVKAAEAAPKEGTTKETTKEAPKK